MMMDEDEMFANSVATGHVKNQIEESTRPHKIYSIMRVERVIARSVAKLFG